MIAIGCDHGGYNLKQSVMQYLEENGIEYKDFGTYTVDSCDYPVFADKVCEAVTSGECEKGILICGTGIGMSMAANKHKGIRAAVCSDAFSAEFTRLHNDANIMCMGERTIGHGLALKLVEIFLNAPFEGGKHLRRISMFKD